MRKLEEKNFKVFIDFDGTIAKEDIGEQMFYRFGDIKAAEDIIKRWIDGEINSWQQWRLLCESLGEFNVDGFLKYVDEVEVTDGFYEFVEFCKERNIDITVVSDGLELYLKRFLEKNNLTELKYYCNSVTIGENNTLIPSFPYRDEECSQCANCKRNHIITNSDDDDFTIYIGDGYSDTCAAQYCDFIFAKKSLLKYCEKNRISYFPFNNFHEVKKRIDELGEKKRLKKRHQAELKRREVYMRG